MFTSPETYRKYTCIVMVGTTLRVSQLLLRYWCLCSPQSPIALNECQDDQ